jgi:NAD(P)-dependent dehydrogenase (short-subunit alcohol dehydrogenase family)
MSQQIAYEYARRNASLVLVARREHRLLAVRDNARLLGAGQVLVIAADVVREEDCRRLVTDTVTYFGQRESSSLMTEQSFGFHCMSGELTTLCFCLAQWTIW